MAKKVEQTKPAARSRAGRAGDTSESTRAVDDGGSVKKGEVKDDNGRTLYWARRPFGYEGDDLDRGQVVAFTNARNDEKLIRLGYVLSLLPKDRPLPCRYCKAEFIDLNTLNAHGEKRHTDKQKRPDVPVGARGATVDETAGQVQQVEREQQRMDEEAPLNLDKTAASLGARA